MTIIDDIMQVRAMLDKGVPQAIWFIDRYNTFLRLKDALYHPSYPISASQLFGMQLRCEFRDYIRREILRLLDETQLSLEEIRLIFPFCQRGIWVQMSNGKHYRIKVDD